MMRLFNGFIGFLFVAVMACTGLGQTFIDNEVLGLVVEYNLADRDSMESQTESTWAGATITKDQCYEILVEINQALAGTKFDPNYNGNPNMRAAKEAFEQARNSLEDQLGTLDIARTIAVGEFNTWRTASGNLSSPLAASLAFWRETNFYAPQNGYSFAQVEAGLNAINSSAITQRNSLATYLSVAENSAGGFNDLKTQFQDLLDQINSF